MPRVTSSRKLFDAAKVNSLLTLGKVYDADYLHRLWKGVPSLGLGGQRFNRERLAHSTAFSSFTPKCPSPFRTLAIG